MTPPVPVVFLLDVDNTLLDNDRIIDDLKQHLIGAFGAERHEPYWAIFEKLRVELGYADCHRYAIEIARLPPSSLRSRFWSKSQVASGGLRG